MHAIVFSSLGDADVLSAETRQDPRPGAGEIVVENAAIGVNFVDIYQRRGLYPVALPACVGGEGTGRIAEIGADVSDLKVGDRVVYLSGAGAYAEKTVVAAPMAARLPDSVAFETAAAIFLKALTAHMLLEIAPMTKGRSGLVHAAAGGVGTLLVQQASHQGGDVVAVVGDRAKAEIARMAGARAVIVRKETPDIAAEVRRLTNGRGVDAAFDSVGAATFTASLDSLAPKGIMISYGNASGPVPPVAPLELGRRGSLFLTRPSLFHYATQDRLRAMAAEVLESLLGGVLRPAAPTRFPLDRAADAHRLLESGASTGSIILIP
ncbi:MAG: quinone oxidoreductase [Parvularculaceae bacterium]|nr:quinone oxidoreductase [Parvularculaceae bacterium]